MMEVGIEVRIARYLAGEAGIEEKQALEKDMASDPELHARFLILQKIWQNTSQVESGFWDTDLAWKKFIVRNELNTTRKNRTIRMSWAVAAAIILALGVAFFLFNNNPSTTYTYNSEDADPIELNDGSRIYLNEGSMIEVFSFKKKKRMVELRGEAYFEVNADATKPFIVEAGNTLTEVVGTAFNIDHTPQETTIFVKEGKVIFSSKDNKYAALALTSGEAAVFTKDQLKQIVNPSPNMHAWQSRELRFMKNMPFGSIISDISTYFNKEFSFENDKVKNCRVTIPLSFKEPELKSVLEAVVASVSAEYAIDGNKCIIRGGRQDCF